MNLCVNARDAMPSGGSITIAARVLDKAAVEREYPKAAAQRYLAISVSDTGNGMDEGTKRKIFEPFFTTKEPGKGTGLGLALVHSIVENHHGMIDVESEPGRGTAFHLYLPIEEPALGYAGPAEGAQAGISRGSGTVLLIEDEPFIVEMVVSVLEGNGYAVLTARDGEEGISLFSRHQGDIVAVLSDFGLPKIRGDEVARRIKAMDPDANIVLISGFFDPGIRADMAGIGVVRLLQKPFSFAELAESLRSVADIKADGLA
jgi:CheY-like chemotaxis protein/anti-sigma regulatory factor (Ser/Thr protein kinase)